MTATMIVRPISTIKQETKHDLLKAVTALGNTIGLVNLLPDFWQSQRANDIRSSHEDIVDYVEMVATDHEDAHLGKTIGGCRKLDNMILLELRSFVTKKLVEISGRVQYIRSMPEVYNAHAAAIDEAMIHFTQLVHNGSTNEFLVKAYQTIDALSLSVQEEASQKEAEELDRKILLAISKQKIE